MNIENMIHVPTVEPEKNDYRGEDGLLRCGICGEPKEAFFEAGFLLGGKDRHPADCRCQRERKEREEKAWREQQHRQKVSQYRLQCFQNPIMRKWTFDAAPIQTKRLEQCRRYAESWDTVKSQNAGLLFWGAVGTGKSYLAACIANALIEKEVRVCMTNLAAVIDHDFEGRTEYIQALCSYPLLILDDFGMERDTKFGLETVYQVIDGRYLSGKPLIVTTNLTLQELKQPQDTDRARVYDRVLSMTTPVLFSGPSLRHGQQQENQLLLKSIFEGGDC